MSAANNKTSQLVSSQLPQFVIDDHTTFVEFMENYYKFMERDGETSYVAKRLAEFLDIDIINEDVIEDIAESGDHYIRERKDYHVFLQKFYDTFIKLIPDAAIADKVLLVKHIKDFYSARGTEKSVRFLLRILFNKDVTFYYPQRDVLRASDGKWFVERSVKVNDIYVNNVANSTASTIFKNKTIRGQTSNTTAIVENVDVYYDTGLLVNELKLSSVLGDFENGETVYTDFEDNGLIYRLSANVLSGIITNIQLIASGNNYTEGMVIPVVSNTGTGAIVTVSKIYKGTLDGVTVSYGGSGFQVNNQLLITSTSGFGAKGNVLTIDSTGTYHPNTYNLVGSIISVEANTAINNTTYSNLNSAISDPCNAWVSNSMTYWTYSNCGPILSCYLYTGGNSYVGFPSIDVIANTVIRGAGILARMEVIDGGLGYVAGDTITFQNVPGGLGVGAFANVTNVAANGMITKVAFQQIPGFQLGGTGYNKDYLPLANVHSATGSGANVIVKSVLADNEVLIGTGAGVGAIEQLTIVSGGGGYRTPPLINLAALGDGTALANVKVISGVYTYPGRYVNDDGHLSAYNFLEDKDYYQTFSYVVKTDESINKYRDSLKSLIHPAGTKLYGEYLIADKDQQFSSNVYVAEDKRLHYGMQPYQSLADPQKILSEEVTNITFNSNAAVTNTDTITLSDTVANANVYIANGFYINVDSQYYRVNSVNLISNVLTVTPNISGNIISNTIVIVRKANVSNVIINKSSHGFTNANSVYVMFDSGDTANLSNGLYVIRGSNTDYFFIQVANSSTSNGNVYVTAK